MSNRPLDITQRQVTAICKGAAKANCVAEIVVGNTIVRLIPEEHAVHTAGRKAVDEEADFRL